jgi:hypothetical protein
VDIETADILSAMGTIKFLPKLIRQGGEADYVRTDLACQRRPALAKTLIGLYKPSPTAAMLACNNESSRVPPSGRLLVLAPSVQTRKDQHRFNRCF